MSVAAGKLFVKHNFAVIGRIGGLPYWASTLKLCSVYSCCYVFLMIEMKSGLISKNITMVIQPPLLVLTNKLTIGIIVGSFTTI